MKRAKLPAVARPPRARRRPCLLLARCDGGARRLGRRASRPRHRLAWLRRPRARPPAQRPPLGSGEARAPAIWPCSVSTKTAPFAPPRQEALSDRNTRMKLERRAAPAAATRCSGRWRRSHRGGVVRSSAYGRALLFRRRPRAGPLAREQTRADATGRGRAGPGRRWRVCTAPPAGASLTLLPPDGLWRPRS